MPFTPIKGDTFKPELTGVQKAVKGVSKAAPIVGGITGGIAGAIAGLGIGSIPAGAIGAAAGTGTGLAFGESLESLFGIQDETNAELAREAIIDPLVAGTVDLATAGTFKVAGQALKPIAKGVSGLAKGIGRVIIPKNATTKAFASIFKTNAKLSKQLKPNEVANEMVKHGFSGDLDDLARISESVSGGNGAISRITRNAVGKIDESIDIRKSITAASKASDNATNVDSKVLKKIQISINNILSKRIGKDGLGIGQIKSLDALDAQRLLEREGYELLNKSQRASDGVGSLKLEQQAQLYLGAAEELSLAIDKLSKIGIVESFKTPSIISELTAISPRLANQFKNAKTISEIRSISAPFVKMSQLIDATQAYSGSAFLQKGQGPGALAVEALTRPESATSFAVGAREISESSLGRGASAVGQGVQGLGQAVSRTGASIPRIFAQLGLSQFRD